LPYPTQTNAKDRAIFCLLDENPVPQGRLNLAQDASPG
jgi:hypothetical protein